MNCNLNVQVAWGGYTSFLAAMCCCPNRAVPLSNDFLKMFSHKFILLQRDDESRVCNLNAFFVCFLNYF